MLNVDDRFRCLTCGPTATLKHVKLPPSAGVHTETAFDMAKTIDPTDDFESHCNYKLSDS
jgi:hypothetical protein